MTPGEAAAELQRRRTLRRDFGAWCELALAEAGHQPAAHHRLLIDELQRIEDGTNDRLMVCMPPGSAKSTYASKLFPAHYLARHPKALVIGASHVQGLADTFSGDVQRLVREHGLALGYGLDNEAVDLWRTTKGGTYRAVGTGGSVTGRRANCVILDDLLKGAAEADSPTMRDKAWAWYKSDIYTRLLPGGRIVFITTRWHVEDVAGRLLDEMKEGGDQWRVLSLPAVAETDDPLGRAPGEALWPGWEDLDALARKRRVVGERAWASLFQQRPTVGEGTLFRTAQIGMVDALPAGGVMARGWDLAATEQVGAGDPDWTAGVLLARTPEQRWIVADVARLRGGPDAVEGAIRATAQRDGAGVLIGLPQDPGQAGKSQVAYLVSRLAGFRVVSSPESGAKETRAAPVASQVNVGNLSLLRAPWNAAFLQELTDFPIGAKDDQVDALSRAFAMLMAPPAPAHTVPFNYMAR